jgi:hypothetical protein
LQLKFLFSSFFFLFRRREEEMSDHDEPRGMDEREDGEGKGETRGWVVTTNGGGGGGGGGSDGATKVEDQLLLDALPCN